MAPKRPSAFCYHRSALVVLVVLGTLTGSAGVRAQRAYHFSPLGDDVLGDGTSHSPWATVAQANTLDLAPGDSLLFAGGASFAAGLYLDAADAGTPERPVVVSSYGEGRATLDGGDAYGLYVYNAGGIAVSRLVVVGSGLGTNQDGGIIFYADLPGDVRLPYVRVEDVDVSGFGKSGLSVGSWNGQSGWRDVRVTRGVFHGNRDGMDTYAQEKGALEDVYVGYCRFYRNAGLPGLDQPSGSGLVLGAVDGALVERSVAYQNGGQNTFSAGPVGIWAYESNAVVIQHNESWGNRTGPGSSDGGGFDLDGGVTDSVVQYNYSHDNDGAGYGVYQYAGATAYGGNVVRYNVSEDDGRKNGYGAITVWGASASDLVRDTQIYHNTVYVTPAPPGRPAPSAIKVTEEHHREISFWNNLLVTSGGVPLIEGPESPHVRFQGNAYWSSLAPFTINWGGTTYPALSLWQEATGQEQIDGANTGYSVDPLLAAPGEGGTIGDPDALKTLTAYRLLPGSPLMVAAFDLAGRYGIDTGVADYYGTALGPLGGIAVGTYEPAEGVTVTGVVDAIDIETGMLTVQGVSFRVTRGTVITGGDGAPLPLQDLGVGTSAAVKGIMTDDGRLAARVVAEGKASSSEGGAGPRGRLTLSAVYPNPAATQATVAVTLPAEADVTVRVYDLLGRLVLYIPVGPVAAGFSHPLTLDVAALTSGAYVVRVTAAAVGAVEAITGRLTVAH